MMQYLAFCQSQVFPEGGASCCPEGLWDIRAILATSLAKQQEAADRERPTEKKQRRWAKAMEASMDGLGVGEDGGGRGESDADEEGDEEGAQAEGRNEDKDKAQRSSLCSYPQFTRTLLPADLVALLAVAAAYSGTHPHQMLSSLMKLEAHMVCVEKAYEGKRTELHAAVGGELFKLHGEDDA